MRSGGILEEDSRCRAVGATANGIIAAESDTYVYRVDVSAAGNYTATASPAALGGDLDLKLDLLDSAGTVVATADPASGQSNAGTPTGLGASVASNLQAGTYYLRIDNVGYRDPLNKGYSTYGSPGRLRPGDQSFLNPCGWSTSGGSTNRRPLLSPKVKRSITVPFAAKGVYVRDWQSAV
ncbi:pre-peptidase C-terminal domain-containing protein [Kribbella sp. VKM Ac-2568]|uniref:pre-peptidase C-terminal domain-containing protein n=1 Tax=Kribbella sp. VKM Ac-2568 TaxID=2512219 RepID=UPI001F545517|nr:pre-peptidase C-terminal domain-containing protein [Kribbella sp. VKM Ac-2568]